MTNNKLQKRKFDLEGRTLRFAKSCIDLCRLLEGDAVNAEIVDQLMRAAGSVGANYREANESATKKEFYHRVGIARRESKESKYWLTLLAHANRGLSGKIEPLCDEALQLTRIFATIAKGRNI